jgi:hypothetical protein
MTITTDFAARSRARFSATRDLLLKLREANKTIGAELTKIAKQQMSDGRRVSEVLDKLAEDMTSKLPDTASDAEYSQASTFAETIRDIAGAAEEEVSLGFDDMIVAIREIINDDGLKRLKESFDALTRFEKMAAPLRI